jgi:hypothetical protein
MSQFKAVLGVFMGILAGLISRALDMIFYEFPKFYLYRFGDFHGSEGFSTKIRGLAIGFQKGDAGRAILKMVFQRGRRVWVQSSFKVITQQIDTFFAANHFFELRVLYSSK